MRGVVLLVLLLGFTNPVQAGILDRAMAKMERAIAMMEYVCTEQSSTEYRQKTISINGKNAVPFEENRYLEGVHFNWKSTKCTFHPITKLLHIGRFKLNCKRDIF